MLQNTVDPHPGIHGILQHPQLLPTPTCGVNSNRF